MADAELEKVTNIMEEAKQDLVYMISYFSLPQPFRIFKKTWFGYRTKEYNGIMESSVKVKGKRITLTQVHLEKVSAEGFLFESIRVYKAKTS